MRLNYAGDVSQTAVGRVMGPDLHGALYEAVRAEYDPRNDHTTVEYRPVSRTDERESFYDEHGQLRVVQ